MLQLIDIGYRVSDENGEKDILKNINLSAGSNRFVVITGPNGSGKSTLLKIIMGIVKPTSGRILFDGQDITNLSITERAALGIGFAFQQPVRFKGLSVLDLLSLAAGRRLKKGQACAYLSEVGLCAADYIDREMDSSLSGGELKRIEIAMLMARQVKLSLFDEPEAGIDLWSFTNLIEVFKRIRKESEGTVIIISHQERILEIADEVVVVADGEISATGSKEDILPTLLCDSRGCKYYRGGQDNG